MGILCQPKHPYFFWGWIILSQDHAKAAAVLRETNGAVWSWFRRGGVGVNDSWKWYMW